MRAGNQMRTPVAACLVAVLSVGCVSRPTYSSAVQGSAVAIRSALLQSRASSVRTGCRAAGILRLSDL